MDNNQPKFQPEVNSGTQPNAEQSPVSQPVSPQPKTSKKKPFIIGGLIALGLLLTGGSALAYNFWYQNPNKVLSDAVLNAVKAESLTGSGTFNFDHENGNVKLTLNNSTDHAKGRVALAADISLKDPAIKLNAKGEGLYDGSGSLYVKLADLDKTYDQFAVYYIDTMAAQYGTAIDDQMKQQARSSMDEQFKPVVDKLNNQWIKIDADNLKDLNEDAGQTQECVTTVFEKLKDDRAMSDEVADIYQQNQFIKVDEDLGAKDGSLGYLLDIDNKSAKQFGVSLKDSQLGKELTKCDDSITENLDADDTIDEASTRDEKLEVWVSRWSHQFTEVNYSAASTEDDNTKFDMTYKPEFNKSVSAEAPKDFITLDELKEDFSTIVPTTSVSEV